MATIISVGDVTGKLTEEELDDLFKRDSARTYEEDLQILEDLYEYEKIHGETPLPFTPIVKKEIFTQKALVFGMNIGTDGRIVSKQEWNKFVDEEITLRFPGFTEREVKGHWEGNREASIELVIACPDRPKYERKLNEIREAYCKKFQQDSVMKINADNTVEF